MNQSIDNSFSADEIEVAGILLDLPNLISESESLSRNRFSFTWGSKRRRSAIDGSPALPPLLPSSFSVPSPTPVRQDDTHGGSGVVGPTCVADGPIKVKSEAPSPATPLSFSPSESDEKSNPMERKINHKRKSEELLQTIQGLTEHRNLLLGEIENVKRYYGDLKSYNLRLKAKEQELSLVGIKGENPYMEIGYSANFNNQEDYHQQQQFPSSVHHHPPLIFNQMSEQSQIFETRPYPSSHLTTSFLSSSGLDMMNSNMGPLGIPDLNVSPCDTGAMDSCSQPLDPSMGNTNLSKVMAAQARQKRIQICRVKNSSSPSKPRYSNR
ncbi:Dihydroxy-acid dehydratase 1 [Quillaja saponaria]|uniref:Dihydroxy-acid dehydratase 1 n=1 Tax=Quillaja saponaria TaxID=32244 RepID=A0AAD7LIB5_QUISA|nr:Dihydroxy-acid dehydratase 1 [Quillaja saponaria]